MTQNQLTAIRRNSITRNRNTAMCLTPAQFGGYIMFYDYTSQIESLRKFVLSVVQYERNIGSRHEKQVETDTDMFFTSFKRIMEFFYDEEYPRIRAKASDYGVVRDMVGRFVKKRNGDTQYFQPASPHSFRKSLEDLIADHIIESTR